MFLFLKEHMMEHLQHIAPRLRRPRRRRGSLQAVSVHILIRRFRTGYFIKHLYIFYTRNIVKRIYKKTYRVLVNKIRKGEL